MSSTAAIRSNERLISIGLVSPELATRVIARLAAMYSSADGRMRMPITTTVTATIANSSMPNRLSPRCPRGDWIESSVFINGTVRCV